MSRGIGWTIKAYGFAVLVTAAVVALRWALDPWLGIRYPLSTLFAAIAVAVWIGGVGPAVLSAALGYAACHYFFVEPRNQWSLVGVEHVAGLIAFTFSSAIIIGFGEAMRRARRRARNDRELLLCTLASIGDGVIATDAGGRVTFLNAVAERLTGFTGDAIGRPLHEVFNIVNEQSRQPVENPATRALREGVIVGLANHTVLIARDGTERPIDDSAAPIRDERGDIVGCVLVFRDVSDRRSVDRALERSESDLRDFFENASVGLHWVGPDGIILRVNKTELDMLGYAREEYVGRHIADFHVDREVIEDILRRLASGETLENYPAKMRCKDGSIRHVLINSNVLWEDGKFVHTRCFTRDVTELRAAEEAGALYTAIVTSSEDAIVSKTLDGIILTWNPGAQRVFGYASEEVMGKPITTIIPPDRLDEECTILERLRRGERIEHFETVRLTKDGRLIDVSLTVSPVRDSSGRVVGASKVARDITARKHAEQALRESEQRLRLALEAGRMGTWEWHVPTNSVLWSPGLEAIHGLPPGTFPGNFEAFQSDIHPDDRDAVARQITASLSEQREHHIEYRIIRPDGQLRWVEGRGKLFRDAAGKPLRMIGVCTDVTDRKLAEQQLKSADRRKDEFLATLAHELRNPLAPIRNSLEILKRADGHADLLPKARDTMDRQVALMERLIDDLLDLSRITRDKLELRRARVDLCSVIAHAVESCRPLADRLNHRIDLRMPTQSIELQGDSARLTQVLSNLLNNACKYTPAGGEIVLSARRDGDFAVVSVRDNGIGIAAEKLPSVFEMFMQVDRSLERAHGGLGIGLTLVRQLVELHGGTVEAFSAGPGAGSEFIVRLPLGPVQVEEQPVVTPPSEPAGTGGRRVLVVDDNRDGAESLAMLLKLSGHEVRIAHDGIDAVSAAKAFRPDLVLLDIGLPGLNGYDAARQIRSHPWGKELTLVALTGWGQDEDRRKSREAGFDSHLVKPVDFDALLRMVDSLPARETANQP